MKNIIIIGFIALMCACMLSEASPRNFKLIEETENELTQTYEVSFLDTNSNLSVTITTIDIQGITTSEFHTFATLQDVITHFEAGMVEDFFFLEISGSRYLFDRKKLGYGYVYDVVSGDEVIKENTIPFNFIRSKLRKTSKAKY